MPRLGASVRFFSTVIHNRLALTQSPLRRFTASLASPREAMRALQRQGHFPNQQFLRASITLDDYLLNNGFNPNALRYTPLELLQHPIKLSFSNKTFADIQEPYKSLTPVLDAYVQTIIDVFGDKLAKRPYDAKEPLNENVSERGHGFEAFVITHHFRHREKNKFAALTLQHDLARATVSDAHYGDTNHHMEADLILAPQGYSHDITTRYPLLHPFAKYLWSEFSQPYRDELLSPVSAYSLVGQKREAASIMRKLDELYTSADPKEQFQRSEELVTMIAQMMLLRLIDDSAKVALPECNQLVTQRELKQLITEQMVHYIQTLSPEKIPQYKESLSIALTLLRRTKLDSDYPERYEPIADEDQLVSGSRGFQP